MDLIREFILFVRQRKKIWIIPILLTAFLLGGLVIFTEGSAIAPFIYTIF